MIDECHHVDEVASDEDFDTYLVSYFHEGSWWGLELPAASMEDAEARLAKLPHARIEAKDGKFSHPTAKQYAVIESIVGHTEGDVFDPFLGSGTTLIAAESLGRRCFGIEIEERYASVVLARFEQCTGKACELLERVEV